MCLAFRGSEKSRNEDSYKQEQHNPAHVGTPWGERPGPDVENQFGNSLDLNPAVRRLEPLDA